MTLTKVMLWCKPNIDLVNIKNHLQCCNSCKAWKGVVSRYQQIVTETRYDATKGSPKNVVGVPKTTMLTRKTCLNCARYNRSETSTSIRIYSKQKQDPNAPCKHTDCMNHETTKTKSECTPPHYPYSTPFLFLTTRKMKQLITHR